MYGKFIALINAEKKYHIASQNISKGEDIKTEMLLIDSIDFQNPEDIAKLRESSEKLKKWIEETKEAYKKLNEENIKEIEGLDIPKEYKEVYLDWRKNSHAIYYEYLEELDETNKVLSSCLLDMANLIDKMNNEKDKGSDKEYRQQLKEKGKVFQDRQKTFSDKQKELKKKMKKASEEFVDKTMNLE